ncbi:uncharacterized RING finger protein P32A8.03c-like [Glycine soja]|uniref:uncharacterized RING finger protein P32A8.03c-like n=1 Tax=Glycine soja TaxID=3848 RepID=UPI00103D8FA2|nr:uncharacterized RING finger protein P32A8.03c-like [Glycine soja]
MTRQFQEPTLFSNVANTFINHMVYISIFVSTFDPSFGVRLCRMQLPIQHDIFNHQCSHCCYNVVGTPFIFLADGLPSRGLVQRMACDGGEHLSLPAGATTLERFMVEDEQEDPCAICIKDFNSGDNAARLPCSHVFHPDCILQWEKQNAEKKKSQNIDHRESRNESRGK